MVLHLAAAFGLLAGASLAREPRVFLEAEAGVAPNRIVTVRWESLPAEAGECELLIDLEGVVRLRITEELDPSRGFYRWAVPNLFAREARIVLRMGRSGVETEIAPSEPFQIGGTAAGARATLFLRRGEIWLSDSGWDEEHPPTVPLASLAGATAVAGSPPPYVYLALPDSGLVVEARSLARVVSFRADPQRAPVRPPSGLSALFIPPRI